MECLNKKVIYQSVIVGFLIILTMILRLPFVVSSPKLIYLNSGTIYSLIYFGLFITWGVSIKRRIIQKQPLKFLITIVVLMLFWFMFRTIKYTYVTGYPAIERWLWYAYYIPMILIPLMSLLVALSLGKLEDYVLPRWTRFIYIPAIILIGFVLTNDLHQMVFIFPGEGLWTSGDFKQGIVYWIIFFWMVTFVFASLILTMIKSRVPRSKKILWMPFIPYLFGFAYGVLYIKEVPFLRIVAGDMTAIFCLFTMAIFESLIQSGLIRSNVYYEDLFYESDLRSKILSNENKLCYQTNLIPIETNSDNIRVSTFPISGGKVVWLEDISKVNLLIKKLEEVNQRLSEENNLLQAELELRERKIKIDEKTRLYNRLMKIIEPQLQSLNKILLENEGKDSFLQENMVIICVLGTYMKRRSNLLILKEDSSMFFAKELEYCLRESVESISLGGIECALRSNCKGKVKAEYVVLAYDLFEEIIEEILPCVTALLINLNISSGSIRIKLQANCDKEKGMDKKFYQKKMKNTDQLIKRKGNMTIVEEDDNLAIIIELPKVGGLI